MSYSLGILLIGLVIAWWRSQGGFDFEKEFLAELPNLTVQSYDRDRSAAEATDKLETRTPAAPSPPDAGVAEAEPRAPESPASIAVDAGRPSTPSVSGEQGQPPARQQAPTPIVAAVAPRQPRADTANKVGKIVLKFSESSWAEIRDASNERLLHQSFHAGREVEVVGMPPFSVFLGNAGGVRMEYNGRPFDITPHQTGLYARFVVEGAGGN
jgi:cytoskeleton protein RodZ